MICGLATPANRSALEQHYDRFLPKALNRCATCHLPSDRKDPKELSEFPHNPFGDRLRRVAKEMSSEGRKRDLAARLATIATEDSDGDGVANQKEILLGHNPGDRHDTPTALELQTLGEREAAFSKFLTSYRWRPFESVTPPPVPSVKNGSFPANPIDAFLEVAREQRGLAARPEASKEVLLRRVYQDLVGFNPSPEEQARFGSDWSDDAYEKVVDRLLSDPRHGERWGRHWMDVWRYSDWAGWSDGNQVRDSQPHIWRWRDWIIESLNGDKGYDRMVMEMLAADELAPLDGAALRATGFLVRNYKMLSREQWMEDTIKHTFQAFQGVTIGCAKCHDHLTDPISQMDYFSARAIFDPYHVRTDAIPGQADVAKDGLVRAYDQPTNRVTYLLTRGDERHPDTNKVAKPGVPAALLGSTSLARLEGRLETAEIRLPAASARPHQRTFVRNDLVAAAEAAVLRKRKALEAAGGPGPSDKSSLLNLEWEHERARLQSLVDLLETERLEQEGAKNSGVWTEAARKTVISQRREAVAEAKLRRHEKLTAVFDAKSKMASAGAGDEKAAKAVENARKALGDAEEKLGAAEREVLKGPTTAFKPRAVEQYPDTTSGRRLEFARWLVDARNPLTARVAVNHVWMRHFGRGLVTTPADFGRMGAAPSHPELLDWLAAEFMAHGWSMKWLHRRLVTSEAYRMASTPDERSLALDPENRFLWRMNSRRLEAESIRDNLLQASGSLDFAMGGPEIDHKLGLTSRRRSVYLRIAPEKEVEFLKVFDGPAVTECYERRPSIMPQQALALGNSTLAIEQARRLAGRLSRESLGDEAFVRRAYSIVLGRAPTPDEAGVCRDFLKTAGPNSGGLAGQVVRTRENLILVLLNHNEAVTIR